MAKGKIWPLVLLVTAVAVLFVIFEWKLEWRQKDALVFTFLDVGQGDSILIETPDGSKVLIDGGPGDEVLSELAEVLGYINSDLDYVIVTHADADHFNGIFEVAKHYSPKAYYINIPSENKKTLEKWWQEENVAFVQGDKLVLGSVNIEVLWPETQDLEDDRNLSSIVVLVEYGDFCGVLTGDAPSKVEEKLVEQYGKRLDCELLKVGHHGSSSSSSQKFLEVVTPDIALILVGATNRYGHPSADVLERLSSTGAVILRTDKLGRIEVWTDGEQVYW